MNWIALRGGAYILTEGQSLFVPYGFLQVIISLQSKENVDKGALLHKVHYRDGNRHKLHKLHTQAMSLFFVNAFAQSDVSKTWLVIKTGMGVAVQVVETGYTLNVIERERRTCVWTSALRHDVQHKVVGFHSRCFFCNAVLVAGPGFTLRSAFQYSEDHWIFVFTC